MRRTGRHDGRGLEYAGSTLLLALAAFVAPAEASAAEDAAPAPGPTEAARSAPIAPASGSVVLHDFRDPPVFSYTEAWDRNYLRALLQYQAITALGVLWYITTTDLDREWRLGYQWETFREKLTGEAFGLDTNHFGTNFIGHPLGGTGYYHAARANRLTWPASFGFAIAGSLFWEYFGEVTETVSANDMLVTSMGGLAIGEATFQLAAFFDRSRPTFTNRLLGTVFGPVKTVNDWLDGLAPRTASPLDENGFPADTWHRFDLGAMLGFTFQDAVPERAAALTSGEARLAFDASLFRLGGFRGPVNRSHWFGDANVSRIALEIAAGSPGIVDVSFETQVVLAGYFARNVARDGSSGIQGNSMVLGAATGFVYALHDYDRDGLRERDRIAGVRPIAFFMNHLAELGDFKLDATFEAGPSFSGIQPYALGEYVAAQRDELVLPRVVSARDYYFGIGGYAASRLSGELGPFELALSLFGESYGSIQSLSAYADELPGPRETLADLRTRANARFSYRLPGGSTVASLLFDRRERWGRVGPVFAERRELTLGIGLGARL
ncbi:MAG TPA: DUF3943 domain-containing protein [Polyangiaceae bacterium]|nr:DUF3943 domain-containing protein [Polyangiaceae bacterium]